MQQEIFYGKIDHYYILLFIQPILPTIIIYYTCNYPIFVPKYLL